eukprot:33238_1
MGCCCSNDEQEEPLLNDEKQKEQIMEIKWNTNTETNNIKFSDDHKTVTKTDPQSSSVSTVLINKTITKEMCNEFSITLIINGDEINGCLLGYVSSINDIKDWNQALGFDPNKQTSMGLLIDDDSPFLKLCDKDNTAEQLKCEYSECPKGGDTFLFCFNFVNDNLIVYHNNNKMDTLSLNGNKNIIPAVSLIRDGSSVQIRAYAFD